MARTPRNYAINQQLSTSATDIIPDVGGGLQSVVSKLSFYNSGASTRTVTVYAVENAGSASAGNTLVVKVIHPGRTWNVVESLREVFTNGASLQASQDAGTDVNVNCSGDDVS